MTVLPLAITPYPLLPRTTALTAAQVSQQMQSEHWCFKEAVDAFLPSHRTLQAGTPPKLGVDISRIQRRISPLLTSGPNAMLRLVSALSVFQEGGSNPLIRIVSEYYQGDFVRDALLYRLFWEAETEAFFRNNDIPLLRPLSRAAASELEPFPFIDCGAFLLNLLFPFEEAEKAGINLHALRNRSTSLLERIVLDHCRAVAPDEDLTVNDLIFYTDSLEWMRRNGALHYARVVGVQEGIAWLESKWGSYRRPCLAPINDQSSSYGYEILVARWKESLPAPQQTLEQAGYGVPVMRSWTDAEFVAAADRLARYYYSRPGHSAFNHRF